MVITKFTYMSHQCDKCKSQGEASYRRAYIRRVRMQWQIGEAAVKESCSQQLRTPKFKTKKVEAKKKYNRKKEVVGYYYDGYNDKTEVLYKEKK